MRKMLPILVILLAYGVPAQGGSQQPSGRDEEIKRCGEPAPPLEMETPPRTPLKYALKDARGRQELSVSYRRAGSVDFDFHRTGRCERHIKGAATIKQCWWLGAETDEDESGYAYFVQEYVFESSPDCTVVLRIGEGDWRYAWINDWCSSSCSASNKRMYLQKR